MTNNIRLSISSTTNYIKNLSYLKVAVELKNTKIKNRKDIRKLRVKFSTFISPPNI